MSEPDHPSPTEDEQLADLGYSEAVSELDQILASLDRDVVDVDDLSRQVRRAAALIRHCRARIAAARTEVEVIVVELEELAVADELPGEPGDED